MFQKSFFFLSTITLLATSCSKTSVSTALTGSTGGATSTATTTAIDSSFTTGTAEGSTETGINAEDLVENSAFTGIVNINFGSTVSISNPLATSGVTITQNGGDVVVNSTATGVEFQVSGTTTNGSVKLYSEKKFKLVLNGANITNADGPAINIQSSKRAFVVINDNTTNALTDGAAYVTSTEDQKGTLFSEGQVIFSGNGSLAIKANYKHAIASDDYVRIRSGNITISGAITDGIHTNDAVIVDGGTLNIAATSDGIECEEGYVIVNGGSITCKTGDDGIAASYEGTDATITPYVTINGGTISVTSTAGEGIESKSVLTINKGDIQTTTADDGLNAGKAIYINGGNIYSYSSGNDAMDSNGTFTITGGRVIAIGARSPEAGIDCGAHTFKITGGTVIGIGGATSSPTSSVSTINTLVMGSGSANQIIHIEAADGTEALTFLAPASYTTLLFASSKLKSATIFNVYTGGTVSSGSTAFKGLYTSGTYTKGTKTSTTFTTTNRVTQVGGNISRG